MLGAFRFLLVAVECGRWECPGHDRFVVVDVAAAAAAAVAAAVAVGFDSGAAVAWVVYGKPALRAPESYSEPWPCYPRRVASFSPLRRFEADSSLRPHGGPDGRGGGGSAVAAVVGVVPVRAVSSQGCDACKMHAFSQAHCGSSIFPSAAHLLPPLHLGVSVLPLLRLPGTVYFYISLECGPVLALLLVISGVVDVAHQPFGELGARGCLVDWDGGV